MNMITTVRGHRVGTEASPQNPGYTACDRCGIIRADRGKKRSPRNLCRACTCQLTPEQLEAWER